MVLVPKSIWISHPRTFPKGFASGSATCSHLLTSIVGGMGDRSKEVTSGGFEVTSTAPIGGYVGGQSYDITISHATDQFKGFLLYAVADADPTAPEQADRQVEQTLNVSFVEMCFCP